MNQSASNCKVITDDWRTAESYAPPEVGTVGLSSGRHCDTVASAVQRTAGAHFPIETLTPKTMIQNWRKLRTIRHTISGVDFRTADNPPRLWDDEINPQLDRLRILAKSIPDYEAELTSTNHNYPSWKHWPIILGPALSDDEVHQQAEEHLLADRESAQRTVRSILSVIDAVLDQQPSQDVREDIMTYLLGAQSSDYVDRPIAEQFGLTLGDAQGHLDILEEQGRIGLVKTRQGYRASLSPAQRIHEIERPVLQAQTSNAGSPTKVGDRIFIGHGRPPVWLELKDFLKDRLGLHCIDFNSESAAGVATTDRLEQMLDESCFAFLVHTAEDEHPDATVHAREYVIHETGLFQGRLSFKRAIVLLEHGCTSFSNIHGLTHISFDKGNIKGVFEEVRRVLEREGIITAK